jgi:hypothetical protein
MWKQAAHQDGKTNKHWGGWKFSQTKEVSEDVECICYCVESIWKFA